MSLLSRILKAARYLRNPGGTTHKSRLSKQQLLERKKATTDRLRMELGREKSVDRQAFLAVSEALK